MKVRHNIKVSRTTVSSNNIIKQGKCKENCLLFLSHFWYQLKIHLCFIPTAGDSHCGRMASAEKSKYEAGVAKLKPE